MGTTLVAFGRMLLVLALVVGVLLVLARLGRTWQRGATSGPKASGRIDVLSRRTLGKNTSLLVVRVAQRTFLVGQSLQQMTLLAELDGEGLENGSSHELPTAAAEVPRTPRTAFDIGARPPGAWDAFLDHLREMTVRR